MPKWSQNKLIRDHVVLRVNFTCHSGLREKVQCPNSGIGVKFCAPHWYQSKRLRDPMGSQ